MNDYSTIGTELWVSLCLEMIFCSVCNSQQKTKNVIKKLPQPQLLHQLEVPALALVEAQLRRRQGGAVGRPRNQ